MCTDLRQPLHKSLADKSRIPIPSPPRSCLKTCHLGKAHKPQTQPKRRTCQGGTPGKRRRPPRPPSQKRYLEGMEGTPAAPIRRCSFRVDKASKPRVLHSAPQCRSGCIHYRLGSYQQDTRCIPMHPDRSRSHLGIACMSPWQPHPKCR